MTAATTSFVHLNGQLHPASRAHISVFDRGFLYGDGLFETLRAYAGKLFGLAEHLARLRRSASFLGISVPRANWQQDIHELLRRNRLLRADAWVRITLTRGVAPPGLTPPARLAPTVVIIAGAIDPHLPRAQRRGVRATLLPFARQGFLAEHKTLNYVPGVLGKSFAARHHAFEGLFVDQEGCITEGTTSNLFVVRGNRLCTAPVAGLLAGITRRLVIQAAVAGGMELEERPLSTTDLFEADEALITSSVVEVVPVVAVDKRRVGNGTAGPHTRDMQQWYRHHVARTLGRE